MFCKKCGSEIKEGERFCASCGTPVVNSVPAADPVQPKSSPIIGKALRIPCPDGPSNADYIKRTANFVVSGLLVLLLILSFFNIYRDGGRFYNIPKQTLKGITTIISIVLYGGSAALIAYGTITDKAKIISSGRIVAIIAVCRHIALGILMRKDDFDRTFGFYIAAIVLAITAIALYYIHYEPMFRDVIPQPDIGRAIINKKRTIFYVCLGVLLFVFTLLLKGKLLNAVFSYEDESQKTGFTINTLFAEEDGLFFKASNFCVFLGVLCLVFCLFRAFMRFPEGNHINMVLPILTLSMSMFLFIVAWIESASEYSGREGGISFGIHWSLLGWIFVLIFAAGIYLMVQVLKCDKKRGSLPSVNADYYTPND